MKRLDEETEDQIQDEQHGPWFCKLHNRPAEHMWYCTWEDGYRCPDCNTYIETAWEETQETGEFSDRFLI